MSELGPWIFDTQNFFLLTAGTVVIVLAITGAVTRVVRTVSRERTRREIAAYIAEGAMTPEQGERLMAADGHAPDGSG